jgi:hypothetical protein
MNRTRVLGFTLLASLVAVPVACSSTPDPEGTVDAAVPTSTNPTTTVPTSTPDAAPDGPKADCEKPDDCSSKICLPTGKCAIASNTDGVQNNDETDVDCGGLAEKMRGRKDVRERPRLRERRVPCVRVPRAHHHRRPEERRRELHRLRRYAIAPACASGRVKCAEDRDCESGVCDADHVQGVRPRRSTA